MKKLLQFSHSKFLTPKTGWLFAIAFKKFSALFILGMGITITLVAQKADPDDTSALKKRIYRVSILTFESKRSTGYLASLSDSNLYLSPNPLQFSLIKIKDNLSVYPYDNLEKIEIKRKGAAGRGAWHGALIGLAAGVIAGFASGDDPVARTDNPNDPLGNIFGSVSNTFRLTAGEKAATGGFIGAVTGSLIGALIGTLAKKKFIVGRNKAKFHEMRQNILEKLYVNRPEKLQPQE